jgi:glycosyltransferase involved in cell wall biosynthesis
MRILLASEFYYPSVGGVQEVMRQLGERFAEVGHEVVVATTHLPERKSQEIRGVTVKGFRVSGNLVRGMEGEVERYREYVLRQEYDILMIKAAQQWTFDALIPVLDSIRRAKIFIPCGFSGLFDPRYADYFRDMPNWLRQFDRLIFYASDYRDINLARANGLKNLSVLPNGADEREFNVQRDPNFRSRHAMRDDAFVVMTVGSFTGLKGHLELAKAFEQFGFDGPACLLLIGNKPRMPKRRLPWPWLRKLLGRPFTQTEELDEILRRINATKNRRAIFADFPRPEVVQAYLNSNLFVLASKIEYSPLVLFEAAAAGLPFVSVPVGNAAEIAAWTGGGITCDARTDSSGYTQVDPPELAREMKSLAAQPDVRARLGSSGRRAWEQRFSWNTIFRSYERIFQECLEKTSA